MRPIVSGTTLRWLGGNNYITGQPGTAGIILESEGHPLMDSGYNVVSVGNSDYMQGTISRVLYMKVNNWYDDPPQSEKFDITGENIDYSEYFDGQSLPGTDYYELNQIGFGYYDTVYVKEIGGDNLTAEQIFILAYRKEMERKFVEAIVLYKNVISTYKTSNYAVSSVSRIFNCLEKSKAGNNAYNAVKTYYDGLKNSITYPVQIRELAEDLAIKAKVRMGFIEDAISDYQTIINNNQNNPKGIHAQVNKLVLMNMNNGGDNMLIGNKMQKESYIADLLSLITGKKIQAENKITNNIPGQFKLYQNYPNPFNPKTSIKYDIPVGTRHGVFVQLKIYDITGKEILSITELKQAGGYSFIFDGTNYASGLYLYRLEVRQAGSSTGNYVETKKMVLMK